MTLHQIEVFRVYPFFNRYYSVDEFDLRWNKLIRDYNAKNNEWAKALYSSRHQWADTHLRGSYFGGSMATNRCESMNTFLKRFLDEKLPLWRALQHYDHELIEQQFASIYNRNMFLGVRNQITHSKNYNVVRHHKL